MSRRKEKQLSLNVRFYRVTVLGLATVDIQAPTAAAAKYQVFKKAHEAGYFGKDEFIDFAGNIRVREVRK